MYFGEYFCILISYHYLTGIVKFHVTSMTDVESEVDAGDNISMKSSISFSACSLLDNMVGQIRESMGVESHAPSGLSRFVISISWLLKILNVLFL